jgi:predicted SAM-dependent methyltransferase
MKQRVRVLLTVLGAVLLFAAGFFLNQVLFPSAPTVVRMPPGPRSKRLDDPAVIARYIAEHAIRKLQLGAGSQNPKGWLNTEIVPSDGQVYLDATARFPLPDATFNYVHAEQLIEHLEWKGALSMLKESHRVLVPGGRIRVVTPNLLRLLDLFAKEKTPIQKKLMDFQIDLYKLPRVVLPECATLNLFFREWGHTFLYDPVSLRATLEEAGFREVEQLELGVSRDPELRNVDMHHQYSGRDIDEYTSMFFEAKKP